MLHFEDFESHKWKGDFVLRYDMTEQKTALFYGYNSVTDITTQAYSYIKSNAFVIPSDAILYIKAEPTPAGTRLPHGFRRVCYRRSRGAFAAF